MPTPERYGYATARIRAMERRFVDQGVLQRMLDAEDLSSALKVLGETAYAPWLAEMKSERDFDRPISSEMFYCYEEVRQFVPDPEMGQLLRITYDFHNIKVILKSMLRHRRGQSRRWDLLTNLASRETDDLLAAMESEDYRLLPYGLSGVMEECLSVWEQTQDIVEVEKRLDAQLFRALGELAKATAFPGVLRWFRARVDAENIRNLLRLRRAGEEGVKISEFLHEGGNVSLERLVDLGSEPVESWSRVLHYADVAPYLAEMGEQGSSEAMLVMLEKALDDYISGMLAPFSYTPFAPENVLRFLWSKEIETKNVRIVLVSKTSGLDRDMVRKVLRRV